MTGAKVFVAAGDAAGFERTNQLLHLVDLLIDHGYDVHVVLVRGGAERRRIRKRLGRRSKLLVADDWRRRGPGLVLSALGRQREAMAYRAWRMRRSMRSLRADPWILVDPESAWFLKLSDRRPPVVVAHLADPGLHVQAIPTADRPVLMAADLWLTLTEGQAAEVRAVGVDAPVHAIGDLLQRRGGDDAPWVPHPADPVVLSTPSGGWSAPAHTSEVAVLLHQRAPGAHLVWLVDPGEDAWLAEHDVAQLDEAARAGLELRGRDAAAGLTPRLIIRTGYAASDPDLVLRAAASKVPTIGFEVGDLPAVPENAIAPFEVEELVDRAVELLDDQQRELSGTALAAAVGAGPGAQERLEPLHELLRAPLEAPQAAEEREDRHTVVAERRRRSATLDIDARSSIWWAPKILPIITAAVLAALTSGAEPTDALVRLVAMVVSAVGVAVGIHLVNDWADIDADAAAGKPNTAAGRTPTQLAGVVAATLVWGVVPWVLVGLTLVSWILFGLLLLLPVLYSVPPVRLKGRGGLGVASDALNVHVVPTAFAFALLVEAGSATTSWWVAMGGSLLWAAGFGVRGILHHQTVDLANDRVADVETFVARHGRPPTVRAGWAALGVEVAGLVAILVAIAMVSPWVAWCLVGYLGLWTLERRWEPRPFHPIPEKADDWMPLAEFYEVWPLTLLTLALCVQDLAWLPLPVVLLVAFRRPLVKQSRDLGVLLRNFARDVRTAIPWLAWKTVILAQRAGWQVVVAARRLGHRLALAVLWVGHQVAFVGGWIWWHPLSWLWWHPLNWLWWHPIGWVRFQVLRRLRWWLLAAFWKPIYAVRRLERRLRGRPVGGSGSGSTDGPTP